MLTGMCYYYKINSLKHQVETLYKLDQRSYRSLGKVEHLYFSNILVYRDFFSFEEVFPLNCLCRL